MSAVGSTFEVDLDSGEWTPERLDAVLAEPQNSELDWRRFEIVDGVLVVSPPAHRRHESKVMRLGVALSPAIPPGFELIAATGIAVARSYRVTDLAVVTSSTLDLPDLSLTGADVLLAVEIESPSSITTDRITKPAQYASAGVAHYWRVETDPLRLVAYRLSDGVFVETGSWGADETARIEEPFPVEIAVGSLLPSD